MIEYRFVTFNQPLTKVFPPDPDTTAVLTVDFLASVPGLAAHMDGWEPVNFQVVPSGDRAYLVVLLKTQAAIPQP